MPAGRLKACGFAAGFIGRRSSTCSALVIIGMAATGSSRKSHANFRAALEFALALALITLALRVHRRPPNTNQRPTANERSEARTQALIGRLGELRLLTTVIAAFLLGIGGPKRLVLTSLAATTIVTAGLSDPNEAELVVVYVTFATALVWGPVILFLLVGKRILALMDRAQGEVGRRQPQISGYALLVIAAFLVINAVGVLLTKPR